MEYDVGKYELNKSTSKGTRIPKSDIDIAVERLCLFSATNVSC